MSRYCVEKKVGPILHAAQHWKNVGLLSDGSVFTLDTVWTLPSLKALDQYFVSRPDEGEGSFYEKLEVQLEPTEPEVKQLAAEMLWFMLLCPSNIGASKKREDIQRVWEWSGELFSGDSAQLTDEVLHGVGRAGTSYNVNRWREMVFFIRTMTAFKNLTKPEQNKLLSDGWVFAQWIEQIPDCKVRQLRNMILFLLFPDEFERMFGGEDRKKVVMAFLGMAKTQVKKLSALKIDQHLSQIRKLKEEEYGTHELDFYAPPLSILWGDSGSQAWLFTWSPKHWKWTSLTDDRAATHEGKTVTYQWRCSNRSARTGDKAFLVKVGSPPKGVVAIGNIVSEPYKAPHWDEKKADQGKTYRYVDIAFSRIQDPIQGDSFVTESDLEQIKIDKQVWFPGASGIGIKQRSARMLEEVWENAVETTIIPEKDNKDGKKGIKDAVNRILYGPPGTGKTYRLKRLAEYYSSKKQSLSREAWLIQEMLDVRWFDTIFGALYDLGGKGKVDLIKNHEFVQMKLKSSSSNRSIRNSIWALLQTHTLEKSSTVQYTKRREPLVFDKGSDSVWYLAGDWKEECSEQVELAEHWKAGPKQQTSQQRYEFVTFHQAYSYEDFVEGIRPVKDEETGNLGYQVMPGIFKRICLKAKTDPEQRYAIFIDEINRGNIAKIFGELITLIEADKRVVYDEDGFLKLGIEVTLPYSGEKFGVPSNLDIYGTMNTADRSIALLDTALRRRFQFEELMPDAGVISGLRGDGYIEDGEGGTINLRALLEAMNRRIRFLLNRDMVLGHAYFINVRDFCDLKNVLLKQVVPLLQEYFYEDWHRIQLVFRDVGRAGEKLEPQIVGHDLLKEEDVIGFDHDDFEDLTEYQIVDEVTPDAIRKVYEENV